MTKFIRRTYNRYSKLGLRRKKKQVWRSPKGRHSKTREKRRGYGPIVSIGYSTNKKTRGKISGKKPTLVNNISEMSKLNAGSVIIIGKVGMKKKVEIAKEAKKKNMTIFNFNMGRFLKRNQLEEKK